MSSIIRAIDVGYGNTKYTTGYHDTDLQCGLIPSLVAKPSQFQLSTGLTERRDIRNVIINGRTYVIGPDVETLLEKNHTHPLHSTYSESDAYKALHLGALNYMDVSRIDLLVLGLPVHLVNTRSEVIKQKFIGEIQLNEDKHVVIDKVSIVAQPMGGYVYYTRQNALTQTTGFKNQKTLIIDPGYYTFDWMVAKGYMPLDQNSGAEEGGMSTLLECIANEITQDTIINPQQLPYKDFRAIDHGLQTGHFKISGHQVNLNHYLADANKYTQRVFDVLVNKAGHGTDIDNVVLVGGAAPYFKKAAEYYFPNHHINIIPESIYANVRGFQILGETYADKLKGEAA